MSGALAPRLRSVHGLQLRFAESAPVDCSAVLLLNPWPERLYASKALWPGLSAHSRLVAIDPPGFGRSQACEDLFSPRAQATRQRKPQCPS